MTERDLADWMVESWVNESLANVLAEAAFAEEPPRALDPPEIMAMDASINPTMCMVCSDIMEEFFETGTRMYSSDTSEGERMVDFEPSKLDKTWEIVCPVCMESSIIKNNGDAGLFIFSHQILHQFENNGAIMRSWDEANGGTGQAGDEHGK